MHKLVISIGFAIAVAIAWPAAAQTAVMAGSAPGKVGVAQTVKLTATITAIDKATRDVTLKGPQGNEVTVTAGPDVKNFDKMHVGDQVDVQYVEALTLELKKGGGLPVARTETAGAKGAKPGEQPAGAVGRQVTIVADVIAVDPAKQIVTLRGPQAYRRPYRSAIPSNSSGSRRATRSRRRTRRRSPSPSSQRPRSRPRVWETRPTPRTAGVMHDCGARECTSGQR